MEKQIKFAPFSDPKLHGTWVDVQGKTYMFSFANDTRTVKLKIAFV